MVILPSKTLERKLFEQGFKNIVGVDEVGVGCLAGPVVVCAVMIDKKLFRKNVRRKELSGLRDSKLLTPKQREKYFNYLILIPEIKWEVSFVHSKTIDKYNVYQATRLGMKRSLKKFIKTPDIVLVDGKYPIKGLNIPQRPIVKGDRKIFSIACASLIAKVTRDNYMIRLSKKYPEYEFHRHKGYGTKIHQARLKEYGPSNIHRYSFNLKKFI
jgi:ribonuclease HII